MITLKTSDFLKNKIFFKNAPLIDDLKKSGQVDQILSNKLSSNFIIFDSGYKMEIGFFKLEFSYFSIEEYHFDLKKNIFIEDVKLFGRKLSFFDNYFDLIKINDERYDCNCISFYFDDDGFLYSIFQNT